ncbi:MAG TPA: antibiotic biosynthesis monooxygenase [Solirubrobacterales bacterium]|nr:antibiotic biosynthesis monooxygenase [Solirubrobacterales bacterium]
MPYARVTRIEADADQLDEMASQFEEQTVPLIQGLDGYRGYALLGDRGSGAAMAITYWESEDAMRASEDAVKPERDRAVEAGQASGPPSVERYEVVSQG